MNADILRRLAALKLPSEAMSEVLSIIADVKASDEERKAKDRDRKRKSREVSEEIPRNVTGNSDGNSEQKAPPSLPPFSPPHTPPYNPPNPPPEKHTHSAREADFRSAIASEYTRAGFLPPDTGRAVIWLQNGWQESICVEAVRAGLARKGKQLPLNYFEGQIADAHAPVPIGSPNQRAGPASREKPTSLATQILQRAAQNERNRTESQPIVIDAFPVARGAG